MFYIGKINYHHLKSIDDIGVVPVATDFIDSEEYFLISSPNQYQAQKTVEKYFSFNLNKIVYLKSINIKILSLNNNDIQNVILKIEQEEQKNKNGS